MAGTWILSVAGVVGLRGTVKEMEVFPKRSIGGRDVKRSISVFLFFFNYVPYIANRRSRLEGARDQSGLINRERNSAMGLASRNSWWVS